MLVLLIIGIVFTMVAEEFRKERFKYTPIMGDGRNLRDIKKQIYQKGINCSKHLKKQICMGCTNTDCQKRYEIDRSITISVYIIIATLYSFPAAGIVMGSYDFIHNNIISIMISALGLLSIMLLAYLYTCRMFQLKKFKEWTKKTTIAIIVFVIATTGYIMLGL